MIVAEDIEILDTYRSDGRFVDGCPLMLSSYDVFLAPGQILVIVGGESAKRIQEIVRAAE